MQFAKLHCLRHEFLLTRKIIVDVIHAMAFEGKQISVSFAVQAVVTV